MTDTKRHRRALITGITGQDGFYLSQILLDRGYGIIGTSTREVAVPGVEMVAGDIGDESFVERLVREHMPDEIYNLASVATVARPWEDPAALARVTALAPVHFLEAIRRTCPTAKFFQASSAEMYGDVRETPQNENTPFAPINPYGAAKLFAHEMTELYRKDQNIFAVSGILFNHESPRRSADFVTRKITRTLASIAAGSAEVLELGDLDAERDWSFAGDIAEGMVRSLAAPQADSYVFASGEIHTVRAFVEEAAAVLDLGLSWSGSGMDEVGKDRTGKTIVRINPSFVRQKSVHTRCGDSTKAHTILGWKPAVSFSSLVEMMVKADVDALKN